MNKRESSWRTKITVQKVLDEIQDVEHHTHCSLIGCTEKEQLGCHLAWQDGRYQWVEVEMEVILF